MLYPIDIHQYSSDICEHKEKIMKTFRQNRLIGVLCVMMSCAFCSCSELEGLWDESETGTSQEKIPVRQILLLDSEIQMEIGESKTIEIKSYMPSDATELTFRWVSNAPEVATVDQDGKVTAVSKGKAKITVASGNAKAYCDVTVLAEHIKYVDEYGIDHGYGVRLGEIIWAPVNCGYHAEDFPYGKLYQWGRKYGQGLGAPYDKGTVTIIDGITSGGVSLSVGQSSDNADKFFTGKGDWLADSKDNLWNTGTESSPKKSDFDPCPEGWRVPVDSELTELAKNYSDPVTSDDGQRGRYFSGVHIYTESAPKVFLPVLSYRTHTGSLHASIYNGWYWSASPRANSNAYCMDFYAEPYEDSSPDVYPSRGSNVGRVAGYSVRCVQE